MIAAQVAQSSRYITTALTAKHELQELAERIGICLGISEHDIWRVEGGAPLAIQDARLIFLHCASELAGARREQLTMLFGFSPPRLAILFEDFETRKASPYFAALLQVIKNVFDENRSFKRRMRKAVAAHASTLKAGA